MKKYIGNINVKTNDYTKTLERIIFECNSKKDFINFLIDNYSNYFPDGKVVQKITSKTKGDIFIFVTIFELDEYWEEYWTKIRICNNCGKEYTLLKQKEQTLGSNVNFCSEECKEHDFKKTRFEDDDFGYYEKTGKFIYIYKITNKTNGKCYIGKTINHYIFRWWSHLKADTGTKFHEAIKNSDETDWIFEVIKVLPKETSNEDVFKIETEFILKYNSIENGYNTIVSHKTI